MSSPTPTPSPTPKEVNFKTLATDFEKLANFHKQLNSFGLGDIDQLTYWTQSRLKEDNTEYQSPYYPLLYIVPSKVENDLQYKVWEFNTTVSDIVEGSLQNNEDTLSDTLQILQDVISQFRLSTTNILGNYYDKYYVDDDVLCTPFLGEQDDDLNGWNGLLRIKTMTSLDRCAAAFNEWTGASITHPNGINLKTFTDDFRILSDYHKQIQSYGFGKMDEFTYWNEMRLKEDNTQFNSPYYPYFYVIPNDVIQKFGFMEYKFTFIVSDIIQRSLENQVDVLSDTLQIMDDILGQFRLSVSESLGNFNELYYLDTPIVCTPFLEKYDDLLGGWVAEVTIEVKTPLDRCDAAFNPFVSPTVTPTPTKTPDLITPTPTPSNTQTPSVTPTNTPTNTATNTQTPTNTATNTQTPTNTLTPTRTPTQTPNVVCPEEFIVTNSNSGFFDNGTYTRQYLASGQTFQSGYVVSNFTTTGYVVLGTAPDGKNYSIFQYPNGGDINTVYVRFTTAGSLQGWHSMEQGNNILNIGSTWVGGSTSLFNLSAVTTSSIEIGGISFPRSGQNLRGYITYPVVCPTQTPTQTPTHTPTPSSTPIGFCYSAGTGFNDVSEFLVQYPSGEMVIGGRFTEYQGISQGRIVKLNSDATINSFSAGTGFDNSIFDGVVQPDGKIIVVGIFEEFDGTIIARGIARLNTDGTLDNTFNSVLGFNSGSNINTLKIQSDGKIIVGGDFTSYSGISYNNIIRLESDGSVDNTFNIGTGFTNQVRTISIQSDGKIIVGGNQLFAGEFGLVRLNTDGTKDNSFSTNGFVSGVEISSTIIDPDGKIMVGGNFNNYSGTSVFNLIRLNTDGTLDNTFSTAIFNTSGVPDVSGISNIGGQYLITGNFNQVFGVTNRGIVRLNSNGSIDNTFNSGTGFSPIGIFGTQIFNKVLNNGVYAIFGEFTSYKGTTTNRLAFLNQSAILVNCPIP